MSPIRNHVTQTRQRYWRTYWERGSGGKHRHNEEWFFKRKAAEIADIVPSGGALLDYGCGSADLLVYYAPLFRDILATDFSEIQLAAAQKRGTQFGVTNISFHQADENTLEAYLGDRLFDCIVLSAVVQHLEQGQLATLLALFRRHLTENGVIALVDVIDPVLAWLWRLGFLDDQEITFVGVGKRILRQLAYRARRVLKRLPPDEIGYAYPRYVVRRLAEREQLSTELLGARHYSYRYHAILRLR